MAVRARKAEAHLAGSAPDPIEKPQPVPHCGNGSGPAAVLTKKPSFGGMIDVDRDRHDVFNLVALVRTNKECYLACGGNQSLGSTPLCGRTASHFYFWPNLTVPILLHMSQVFVNGAAFLNWDLSKLREGPESAWTDEYFYLVWAVRKLMWWSWTSQSVPLLHC